MDNIIYTLHNGTFVRSSNKVQSPSTDKHANFLIVCDYGDWSGFRTLAECEKQIPELMRSLKYYKIVER